MNPPAVEMSVTELRRTGTGGLEDTPVVFRFSGNEHSSNQDGLDMEMKVESKRRTIPGSNRVVEHAMHASWDTIEFRGEWNDKWGNRKTPPGGGLERSGSYAFTMYQEFGKMVARMPLVRVELDALSYVGLITSYKPTYITKTDFRWSFALSPHENENLLVEGPITTIRRSIPKWLEDCKDLNTNIFDTFDRGLTSASLKTERVLSFRTILLEFQDAVTRLEGIVNGGLLDTNVTESLLLLATTFRRVAGAGLAGFNALRTVTSDQDVAFDSIMAQLKHAEWIALTTTQCWQMIGLGRDGEQDMRERLGNRPKAIHYAKRSETLEKISLRYYGTPDAWRVIYERNFLTSLVLNGTEELIIPERKT